MVSINDLESLDVPECFLNAFITTVEVVGCVEELGEERCHIPVFLMIDAAHNEWERPGPSLTPACVKYYHYRINGSLRSMSILSGT